LQETIAENGHAFRLNYKNFNQKITEEITFRSAKDVCNKISESAGRKPLPLTSPPPHKYRDKYCFFLWGSKL
jgi:hypothetical protein